jgi:hypothetical protein
MTAGRRNKERISLVLTKYLYSTYMKSKFLKKNPTFLMISSKIWNKNHSSMESLTNQNINDEF